MLPAGIAFDLPLMGAEGEGVDDVAAHATLVVAEGRDRLDPTDQIPLRTPPDEGDPIAELGESKLKRLDGGDPALQVDLRWHSDSRRQRPAQPLD